MSQASDRRDDTAPRNPAADLDIDAVWPDAVTDLVRLGRDYDGGYVVSQASIDAADVVLSFGVNDDVSFEAACARRRPQASIVCFDPTVDARVLFRRCARLAAVSLGCAVIGQFGAAGRKYGYARRFFEFVWFFRPANRSFHGLWVADADGPGRIGIDTIFRRFCRPSDRVFVKMDIEGAEYRCLGPLLAHAERITGLAVEFHDTAGHWPAFRELVQRLRGPFHLAHTHGNNFDGYADGGTVPNTLELSFVSKRLVTGGTSRSPRSYPVAGLDMPNHHRIPDMVLAFGQGG